MGGSAYHHGGGARSVVPPDKGEQGLGRHLVSACAPGRRLATGAVLALALLAPLAPRALAGAPASSPVHAAPANPPFDAVAFFSGRTTGEGVLKKIFSAPQATRVVSIGKVEPDGALVLDQTVTIEGYKTLDRVWRLRQTAPGQFQGTLTGARNPVEAKLVNGVLHIDYTDKDGFAFRQQLTLAPGGQSAHNVMKIKRFGITVATVDETITRG